jgi:hypothetical protein
MLDFLKVKAMKKIIISLTAILLLIISSCYDDNKNATVRINLGNLPVAKHIEKKSLLDTVFSVFIKNAYAQTLPQDIGVIKIHLAAYNGDLLIAKVGIDTSGMNTNVVEFSVPAGDNITILVVGETKELDINDNYVSVPGYYGFAVADLKSGETTNVTISNIKQAKWDPYGTYGLTFDINCSDSTLSWTDSGVKTKYILKDPYTNEILYEGYETGPVNLNGDLIVDFEAFDLQTLPVQTNGC